MRALPANCHACTQRREARLLPRGGGSLPNEWLRLPQAFERGPTRARQPATFPLHPPERDESSFESLRKLVHVVDHS